MYPVFSFLLFFSFSSSFFSPQNVNLTVFFFLVFHLVSHFTTNVSISFHFTVASRWECSHMSGKEAISCSPLLGAIARSIESMASTVLQVTQQRYSTFLWSRKITQNWLRALSSHMNLIVSSPHHLSFLYTRPSRTLVCSRSSLIRRLHMLHAPAAKWIPV